MRQNELIVRLRSLQYDLEKITKEFGDVAKELETKTDRWLVLSEFA